MPVPYTFGTATASIPLSQLDSNFATAITIGNTAVQLGNTVTTLNNMTLANVTVSSGNVTITNVSVTTANATTANVGSLTVTGNAVISGTDNTNAMLRITQLGTGNALVVEDSANPDSTPFVISGTGATVVGYTTTVATANYANTGITPSLEVQGNSASTSAVGLYNWSTSSASSSTLAFNKSVSGTIGTVGAISALGTDLGNIVFLGDDGTNFIPAASILAELDGTPGTNDMPGRLVFSTTADGGSSPTERMRIDSSGNVLIGNNVNYQAKDSGGTARGLIGLGSDSYTNIFNAGNLTVRILNQAGSAALVQLSDANGNLSIQTSTGSLGYGTGSGGTVTQATSKTTGVTLNKPTGQITMNNAALAANTTVRFLVTNSIASVTDCIMVTIRDGVTAGAYLAWVDGTANGSFTMAVRNITAGSLSDAVVLNFSVIKGATS